MEHYALQIEKAILSSIIFNPDLFERVASILEITDFFQSSHQYIYKAIIDLHKEDLPIDEEFIAKKLKADNKPTEDIIDVIAVSPIIDIDAYIDEIKDRSIKRLLNSLAINIKDLTTQEGMKSTDILDEIQSNIYKISQHNNNSDFINAKDLTIKTLEHIEELKKRGNNRLIGTDTGFRELNEKTTGFNKGDFVIIAARPSMGKTTLALNMAQKMLDANTGVAIFSLEMPAEQLMLRMMSSATSIHLQDLRVGNLENDEWERLSSAMDDISKKSLFIDDGGNLNIHMIRSKLRNLKSKNQEVGVAIIDYLQLMSGSGTKDRHLEVSEISRGLKMLARELEMPIIALSQLNRSLESRSDKRPMLSDLRESGAIEQDADLILFVYRDAIYRLKEEKEKEELARKEGEKYTSNFVLKNEEEAEIIIGKQRNGPTGIIKLLFHRHCTRFVNNDDMNYQETKVIYKTKNDSAPQNKPSNSAQSYTQNEPQGDVPPF